jgi:hypothetical protein
MPVEPPTSNVADLKASLRAIDVGDVCGRTEVLFVVYKFPAGILLKYVFESLSNSLSYRSPVMTVSLMADSPAEREVVVCIRFGNYMRTSLQDLEVDQLLPLEFYRFDFSGVALGKRTAKMLEDFTLLSKASKEMFGNLALVACDEEFSVDGLLEVTKSLTDAQLLKLHGDATLAGQPTDFQKMLKKAYVHLCKLRHSFGSDDSINMRWASTLPVAEWRHFAGLSGAWQS